LAIGFSAKELIAAAPPEIFMYPMVEKKKY
jgi:hypothetical protein